MTILLTGLLAFVAGAVLGAVAVKTRRADRSDGAVVTALREDADDRLAAAEATQHWLKGALDEAADAVVVVDRIGREVVRNAAARQIVDSRHGDVLAEDALDEVVRSALEGKPSERELALYGPPPQVLQLRAVPLRRSGEVTGAVAFMRDVSEARRVEQIRRDFVANVSHELKTPIGALGLLAETMAATDDPNVASQLAERVLREADRLGQMIDDLLDLSNVEAQELSRRVRLPVERLLHDAVEHVQAKADGAQIPVQVREPVPDASVSGDPVQLRSALVNLIDNAIKYSPGGAVVEVGARIDGARVGMSVRDHGIGIPSRDLERIFERFYRVDRARSRDTGGSGLGLAIVRHVAQAHGGDVVVESREGEGSTFTLQLPLASPGPQSLSEAS